MLRSFARRGGIVLAALALPVLFIGSAATATTPSQAKLASATINGDGSTFQLGFNQVCIGEFKKQQKAVTIYYQAPDARTS
jgi:ABC-type phosphate transport system substrate-binding protein